MARIEISVQNRVAWQTNSMDYICGNGDFVIGFVFDKEWNEFETKTARFIHGGEHTDIVFTGTECKVPKIFNVKRMEVGVFAGDLYTTTPAFVRCRKSILCDSGVPAEPAPDVYAQVMKLLNNGITDEQIAKAIADYMEENPVETGSKATVCWVELFADKWVEDGEYEYSQVVTIQGLPEKFDLTGYQVDLTPSREVLAALYYKDAMMVAENEKGVVTVCLIGQKLTNDYTVQVTITEVGE